jgi:2-hydroxychromene-2-carboxylate isomerase
VPLPARLPARLPACLSYEEGANISEPSVLLEVGRQLGLPEAELQAALG